MSPVEDDYWHIAIPLSLFTPGLPHSLEVSSMERTVSAFFQWLMFLYAMASSHTLIKRIL
jgi:hypothetical protein